MHPGRPLDPQPLTDTERRVVVLVARGRSNAEVGAELSMARRTVEAHLSRVYAKLGINSREQLARVVAAGEREATPARR